MAVRLFDQLELVREQLEQSDHILFALDFDGTLAAITNEPDDAALCPDLYALLADFCCSDRLSIAVISGRALPDLKRRIKLPITFVGNHGLELEGSGVTFVHSKADSLRRIVDHACWDLEAALHSVRGAVIERKGLSAAVHYRQAPASICDWIEATVRMTVVPHAKDLEIRPAKKAWEIRPRVDWNKGDAIKLLLRNTSADRPSVVCAGDDWTDEDMFGAAPDAISIRVGEDAQTSARYFIGSPGEVATFLRVVKSWEVARGELTAVRKEPLVGRLTLP